MKNRLWEVMGEKYTMKKWILFIAAILLLCSSIARADNLEIEAEARRGAEAHKEGNFAQAQEILRPLAAKGDVDAQYNLGMMYDYGKGVTQDYKEAVKWYLLAAEQGSASAQYNLGVMYDNGEGVIQDYVRANMWFILVTSKGEEKARKNREEVTKKMTPAQIAEAQKMARECEKKNYKNCE